MYHTRRKDVNEARRLLAKMQEQGGDTPLSFMFKVLNHPKLDYPIKLEAAAKLAPYLYSKQPVELQHTGEIQALAFYTPNRREMKVCDSDFIDPEDVDIDDL